MNDKQIAAVKASIEVHLAYAAYVKQWEKDMSKDESAYTAVLVKAVMDNTEIWEALKDEDKSVFGSDKYRSRLGFNKMVYDTVDATK
jgi:hypothetical protein